MVQKTHFKLNGALYLYQPTFVWSGMAQVIGKLLSSEHFFIQKVYSKMWCTLYDLLYMKKARDLFLRRTLFLKQFKQFPNGMLRYSSATLQGEKENVAFYRALLFLWCSPLSLSPSLLSLFLFALRLDFILLNLHVDFQGIRTLGQKTKI